MSFTTTKPPKAGEVHQVVVHIHGPKSLQAFREFTKELKALVEKHRGGIGVRGTVHAKTHKLQKRKRP